jgi:hypothetical protein
MNAYRDPSWWSNSSSSVHAKAWLNAGWEVHEAILKEGNITFIKVRDIAVKKSRRKNLEINKPFTPVPVHLPKSKVPSKTKVSKLYARIKNMERNRAEARRHIRGFKARPRN